MIIILTRKPKTKLNPNEILTLFEQLEESSQKPFPMADFQPNLMKKKKKTCTAYISIYSYLKKKKI